jgi:hypothetical protein
MSFKKRYAKSLSNVQRVKAMFRLPEYSIPHNKIVSPLTIPLDVTKKLFHPLILPLTGARLHAGKV